MGFTLLVTQYDHDGVVAQSPLSTLLKVDILKKYNSGLKIEQYMLTLQQIRPKVILVK